jgi:transposase
MTLILTPHQQRDLEAAAAAASRVRSWKRLRAVLLRGAGLSVAAVAQSLGCSEASVYAWTARWRQHGVDGLREGDHGGGQVKLDAAGEGVLEGLLATDPQTHGHRATGWTVPLLQGELAQVGYAVGERTVRRALHRLGYRWKRPRYVLGRPDPAYAEKRGL